MAKRTLRRLQGRWLRWRMEATGRALQVALRPRAAGVDGRVVVETWDAVADGWHNSNTDLTHWRGWFWLCHQTSPYHIGSRRSRLLLWRSRDARTWEKVREFKNVTGREYRDPKFGIIHNRLFLYALPNLTVRALPVTTVFTHTDDGESWAAMEEVQPGGWLFWRPKTRDGATWYVTAYWHEHGRSLLLRSGDGMRWEAVSQIHEGDGNDETDFEFLADGRMLATARLEGRADNQWGSRDGCTLLATSSPPYERWTYARSGVTRLDGPCAFAHNGRVYSIGRYQATRTARVAEMGGVYSRKRTSIFAVEEERLLYLTDLPSAGDTSYAGVVVRGEEAFVSYYTSAVEDDPVWVLGMFRPTAIKMARVSLPALEELAQAKAALSAGARGGAAGAKAPLPA